MLTPRICLAVLLLALGCAGARSDDGHQPSDDPDSGFLEFLGSVDRLADIYPDYLSQANSQAGRPPAATPAAAVPPPPQPPPPPANASASSGSHNE